MTNNTMKAREGALGKEKRRTPATPGPPAAASSKLQAPASPEKGNKDSRRKSGTAAKDSKPKDSGPAAPRAQEPGRQSLASLRKDGVDGRASNAEAEELVIIEDQNGEGHADRQQNSDEVAQGQEVLEKDDVKHEKRGATEALERQDLGSPQPARRVAGEQSNSSILKENVKPSPERS